MNCRSCQIIRRRYLRNNIYQKVSEPGGIPVLFKGERMFQIEEELKKLPAKPGVYIMHDEKDEIIYVGKAVSLKNRVRQYFQSSRNKGAKIEQMVTHISRFEYIITDS